MILVRRPVMIMTVVSVWFETSPGDASTNV